jgi:hypothetical protein
MDYQIAAKINYMLNTKRTLMLRFHFHAKAPGEKSRMLLRDTTACGNLS